MQLTGYRAQGLLLLSAAATVAASNPSVGADGLTTSTTTITSTSTTTVTSTILTTAGSGNSTTSTAGGSMTSPTMPLGNPTSNPTGIPTGQQPFSGAVANQGPLLTVGGIVLGSALYMLM